MGMQDREYFQEWQRERDRREQHKQLRPLPTLQDKPKRARHKDDANVMLWILYILVLAVASALFVYLYKQ